MSRKKETLCLKQSKDLVSGSIPAKSKAIIYYFTSHKDLGGFWKSIVW